MTKPPRKIEWGTLALATITFILVLLCFWQSRIPLVGTTTNFQRLSMSPFILPHPKGEYLWARAPDFVQRWAVFVPEKGQVPITTFDPSAFLRTSKWGD